MNCGRDENPNISYFHPFGYKCFILNTKDKLGKFDSKSDNGIFLGYSKTLVAEDSIHVRFDKNKRDKDLSELDESFIDL